MKNAMRSDRRASAPRPRAIAARQGIRRMKEKPRGSRRKRCGESRGVLIRAGRRRASAPGALRRSRRVAGARIGATTRASNAAVSIIGRIRPILLRRRIHTARFP
ncbi:hypothetical protein [Burkholderia pseudomallei]|uniref:hypothetical protein n=1 Tax=Burkholderia pseudomallei TaxID=28450 RepID=UPI00042526D6|nr:hypothetical protein [Burkholderia pseudomallei]